MEEVVAAVLDVEQRVEVRRGGGDVAVDVHLVVGQAVHGRPDVAVDLVEPRDERLALRPPTRPPVVGLAVRGEAAAHEVPVATVDADAVAVDDVTDGEDVLPRRHTLTSFEARRS